MFYDDLVNCLNKVDDTQQLLAVANAQWNGFREYAQKGGNSGVDDWIRCDTTKVCHSSVTKLSPHIHIMARMWLILLTIISLFFVFVALPGTQLHCASLWWNTNMGTLQLCIKHSILSHLCRDLLSWRVGHATRIRFSDFTFFFNLSRQQSVVGFLYDLDTFLHVAYILLGTV